MTSESAGPVAARQPTLGGVALVSPRAALAVVAAVALGAWLLTLATSDQFMAIMMEQITGSSLQDTLLFVALSGAMMTAMMLPTAAPMVAAYSAVERAKVGQRKAVAHTAAFASAYIALWAAMTAASLPALAAHGVMGTMTGAAVYAPGALLVAAGVYQFTRWKAFCLHHCRTPLAFLMGRYRSGGRGALRMGLEHGCYCLGCCWLLMLVWFIAGAMSMFWMAVMAGLILAEKAGDRSGNISRIMGVASGALGSIWLYSAWATPPM